MSFVSWLADGRGLIAGHCGVAAQVDADRRHISEICRAKAAGFISRSSLRRARSASRQGELGAPFITAETLWTKLDPVPL